MLTRFVLISSLINLINPLAMGAQASGSPDENCILVQNNVHVTNGEISNALGRKLSVRVGKIVKFKTSFSIQASDELKSILLELKNITVPIDGEDYVVEIIQKPRQQVQTIHQDVSLPKYDLMGLVGHLKQDYAKQFVAEAIAVHLQKHMQGADMSVKYEAEWVKVPFPKPHYASYALKFDRLEIHSSSGIKFSLSIRAMPQGNIWPNPPANANSASSTSAPNNSTNSVSGVSKSFLNLCLNSADSPFISIYTPENATLGEIFGLLELEQCSITHNIIVNGTVTIPFENATKKQSLVAQVSLMLPDRDGFTHNRMVYFKD